MARSPGVKLCGWINEWEAVNKDDAKRDQFVLHTQLREQPALSCSPDAAFMIEADGHRCVHYVEVDRGTSGARRVAASKTPGYAELARIQGHRRHFPETTFVDFAVLIITVSANQRDRLAKEVSKKADNRPDLWLFADGTDFTPEKALYEYIFHDHQGIAGPLLQAPANDAAQRNQVSDPADSSLALESAS